MKEWDDPRPQHGETHGQYVMRRRADKRHHFVYCDTCRHAGRGDQKIWWWYSQQGLRPGWYTEEPKAGGCAVCRQLQDKNRGDGSRF